MEFCLDVVRNHNSEIYFVVSSYVSHSGEVNLFTSFSIFLSVLLLLVNNCILPVALRDPGIITSVLFPPRACGFVCWRPWKGHVTTLKHLLWYAMNISGVIPWFKGHDCYVWEQQTEFKEVSNSVPNYVGSVICDHRLCCVVSLTSCISMLKLSVCVSARKYGIYETHISCINSA